MSSDLKYKQAVNVTRRTWDLEEYEKRAQERAEATNGNKRKAMHPAIGNIREDGICEEEFQSAASGATGPQFSKRAFLKARENKVTSLDAKIGSVEIINPEAMAISKSIVSDGAMANNDSAVIKSGVGWHCKVCDCFLKDSLAYLDHINGRKHQRNLGYSMRVERSTKDQVISRLDAMIKAKEQCKKVDLKHHLKDYEEEDFNVIVKVKDEELKRRKEKRKRERKERKKKKLMENGASERKGDEENKNTDEKDHSVLEEDNDESNNEGMDPNIAAMMGFSGFGGGNKNR